MLPSLKWDYTSFGGNVVYSDNIFHMQWFSWGECSDFATLSKQEQQMLNGIFPDLKISTFYYETETALDSIN